MTHRALGALAVTLCLVLAACSGSDDPAPGPVSTPTFGPITSVDKYVAMGDSFVAGPGISPEDRLSGICLRSKDNYPRALAETLGADLDDVSCAGATTKHLVKDIPTGKGDVVDAQLDAVDDDTELITVGIGGNDENVFGGLYTTCTGGSTAKCVDVVDQFPGLLAKVTDNITKVLGEIRRIAPEAKVLLVGYPSLVPTDTTCDDLAMPQESLAPTLEGERLLEGALSDAAQAAGVGFVSLQEASRGHDVCAGDDAWVNGVDPADGDDGVMLHPTAAGMRAVADAVAQALAAG